MRPFARIEELATRAVYLPPGVHRRPHGHFDHSEAGMDAHADAWWAHYLERRERGDGRILWWDLEGGTSRNVPEAVGYEPQRDEEYAACYHYRSEQRLRLEAVRWQSGMAARLLSRARAAGYADFEMGQYNVPKLPNVGHEDDEAIYMLQADDVLETLMCPYFAFGGPSAYFSGARRHVFNWTAAQHVARRAAVVSGVRRAFGPGHKIIPALWARYFYPQGGNDPENYPDGSYMVPSGHMRAMAEGLLDAGVDGFVIWRSSVDDDDPAMAAAFAERWDEVVEVIRRRGGFEPAV